MSTVRIGRDDFKPSKHTHDDYRAPGSLHPSHERRQRIAVPAIPDLRFEHTYLRNVRKHVHVERVKTHSHDKAEVQDLSPGAEVVHVAWGNVLWITFKEQLISPLIQGLLWCVCLLRHLPHTAHYNVLDSGVPCGGTSYLLQPSLARTSAHGGSAETHWLRGVGETGRRSTVLGVWCFQSQRRGAITCIYMLTPELEKRIKTGSEFGLQHLSKTRTSSKFISITSLSEFMSSFSDCAI